MTTFAPKNNFKVTFTLKNNFQGRRQLKKAGVRLVDCEKYTTNGIKKIRVRREDIKKMMSVA